MPLRVASTAPNWRAARRGCGAIANCCRCPTAPTLVSLGEIATPLVALPAAGRDGSAGGDLSSRTRAGCRPASFKARGLAVAVSMASVLGITRHRDADRRQRRRGAGRLLPRAGNQAHVFCPDDTPDVNVGETALQARSVYRVDGLINDCGRLVARGRASSGWFDVTTLKEPYRIEGKKTMGLELAEQLRWELPDAIFYPTGGGTGLIGMWKAFDEMEAIGWIGAKRPRMVAVQTTGCCPIVRAWERGEHEVPEPWADIRTSVHGVRVAKALGDFSILRVIYDSGGFGVAVDDAAVYRTRLEVAAADGVLLVWPERKSPD